MIDKALFKDEIFLETVNNLYDFAKKDVLKREDEGEDPNIEEYWEIVKREVGRRAREREKEIYLKKNARKIYLEGMYDILVGKGDSKEFKEVKEELEKIYHERSLKKLERVKKSRIENNMYDIHVLQNQRRFENQSKVNEIKIKDDIYKGRVNVVEGIQNEMKKELRWYGEKDMDDLNSEEEEEFLRELEDVSWTEEETFQLNKPTTEEEVLNILKYETNLDSAPGEDGMTSRCILTFWKYSSFRWLYIKYLNFSRFSLNFENKNNVGVMVVKNKKSQSIDYDKKRKLMKINKDSNVGNGKVWSNRMKKIILPKILPRNQFNCQEDVNITDEIREIRDVNLYLQEGRKDGTILSIDFNNAFRSISLRWFNIVMKKFKVPEHFLRWFWIKILE